MSYAAVGNNSNLHFTLKKLIPDQRYNSEVLFLKETIVVNCKIALNYSKSAVIGQAVYIRFYPPGDFNKLQREAQNYC